MEVVTTLESLLEAVSGTRVVVIEGARCTGKDHLISRIPGYQVYEVLKPRKQFMDRLTGGLANLPGSLDIQQSHLWTLDVLRQLDVKVLINRSMLSSLYFDGFSQDRFTMWKSMLKTIGAMVVLVSPSIVDHRARIVKAGRSAEAESIIAERNGIQRHALDLEGLVVFSERGS